MSDDSSSEERTEEPTAKRLEKAREDGQYCLSAIEMANLDIEMLANNRFGPNTRWEMLKDPDDKIILDDELEIDNAKNRARLTA